MWGESILSTSYKAGFTGGLNKRLHSQTWKKAGKEEATTHWEVHGPKFSSKLAVELEGHLCGNAHHSIGFLQRPSKNALAGDYNQWRDTVNQATKPLQTKAHYTSPAASTMHSFLMAS